MLDGSKIYDVEVGRKINVLRVCRGGGRFTMFQDKISFEKKTNWLHPLYDKIENGKKGKVEN